RQHGHHVALAGEDLHAVVAPIGHRDVAVWIERDACRMAELARRGARAADSRQERAVQREHLDAIVSPVGYVCPPEGTADVDTPRVAKLSGAGTGAAPLLDEGARSAELLDAVVV